MGCCALNDDVCRELVAWLRRAMYRPAALPQPTPLPRQSRLLLHHAAEPRDEPEGFENPLGLVGRCGLCGPTRPAMNHRTQ